MLTETASLAAADTFLPDILRHAPNERRHLSALLDCEEDDVASRLRDVHLPFVARPFRGRVRPNLSRAAIQLHWRCAVELANFDDAALLRLHRALFSLHEEEQTTTVTRLELMQRILPHFSRLAEPCDDDDDDAAVEKETSDGEQQQQETGGESLSVSYEKWRRFDDVEEDLDELWCARHGCGHKGACPKCVQGAVATPPPRKEELYDADVLTREAREVVSTTGCFEPEAFSDLDDLARRCRVARKKYPRDENLRKASEDLDKRLETDRRQLDVIKQLETSIDQMPDDQVSFDECFRKLRTAQAHMPPEYKASFAEATRQHQSAALQASPSSPKT